MRVAIKTQPDDETCGPTSLHAVYRYYGDKISLRQVILSVDRVASGGTLAAHLGKHALDRGYQASIYVYNLNLFDPTWFKGETLPNEELIDKLSQQSEHKKSKRFQETSQAYIDFLKLGGNIIFHDLTVQLLKKFFQRKIPVLTGLSATYLYQSAREREVQKGKLIYDDLRGDPCGHFVVLCGYDREKRHVVVADPHRQNPLSNDNYYKVSSVRLINAIMLGVLTYDGNLLIIEPQRPAK